MKHAIALIALFAAVASQAATTQIQHDGATRLYRIDVQTVEAMNCPGTLDLTSQFRFTRGDDVALQISLDQKVENAVQTTINQIEEVLESKPQSKADFLAAYEEIRYPQNVCLSFGKARGFVYIDAQNLSIDDAPRNSFEVSVPSGYEITEVVTYK